MYNNNDAKFEEALHLAYVDGYITLEEMNKAMREFTGKQANSMRLLGVAFLNLFRKEAHDFGVDRSRKIFIFMPDLTGSKASILCENTRRLENSFMFSFTDDSMHIASVSLPGVDRPHLSRIPSWLVLP